MNDDFGSCTSRNPTCFNTKFCTSALILLGIISVRSSHGIPMRAPPSPTGGSRLMLLTQQQYRLQKHQQQFHMQQKRSLVQPTVVRNMPRTGETNEDDSNGGVLKSEQQCKILTKKSVKRLKNALGQANATFFQLYKFLPAYTAALYNDTPKRFYEQWKQHSLGLNHPYANYLENIRDIDILPEHITSDKIHLTLKPFTLEMLQTEFQHINQTLKSVEFVYMKVLENRKTNQEQIFHDLRRGNETWEKIRQREKIINEFFGNVNAHLQQDLFQTKEIMAELQVQKNDDFTVTYNSNVQHLEWQLFQEHLAIMKYLVAMYTYILEKCLKQ